MIGVLAESTSPDGADAMGRDRTAGLDRIGVALADPIRRAVLVQLLDGSRCPSDLAAIIGTTRSNLSNHLTCLRGCGLVQSERVGRHLHYDLVSADLAGALRALLVVADTLTTCDDHLSDRRPGADRPADDGPIEGGLPVDELRDDRRAMTSTGGAA